MFGCGGNRDQNKRAKMGKIADLFSDKIYLTDDNPRLEQPSKIRKDIKKGIKKQKIFEFPNRANAISEAIKDLNTGEILLVAGKGHETTQDYGKKIIYGTDNFKSKATLCREAYKHKLPLIYGGLSQWEGQICLFDPKLPSVCFDCIYPNAPTPIIEESGLYDLFT